MGRRYTSTVVTHHSAGTTVVTPNSAGTIIFSPSFWSGLITAVGQSLYPVSVAMHKAIWTSPIYKPHSLVPCICKTCEERRGLHYKSPFEHEEVSLLERVPLHHLAKGSSAYTYHMVSVNWMQRPKRVISASFSQSLMKRNVISQYQTLWLNSGRVILLEDEVRTTIALI